MVEQAKQIIRTPPLWPWDAAQWEPEGKRRGRPRKDNIVPRPVDRMMEARDKLYRGYVKKAETAKVAGKKAAESNRRRGEPYRGRVLAEAAILTAAGVPPHELAGRITTILGAIDGAPHDAKHIRSILQSAGILPPK